MFSQNDRISGRQAFRLLTYDLLGLSTLLVPPFLGCVAGQDGIFCIAFGLIAAYLYLKLLGFLLRDMQGQFPAYLEQKLGKFCGRLLEIGFLAYFVLLASYTAYLFSDLVLDELLREESYYLVLALLLALCAYGIRGGIEGRARVYELLFWVLMLPLFLMLLCAFDEVRTDYWSPVFTAGRESVLWGSYGVFLCFALVFLVLFLSGYVQKTQTLLAAGRSALVFTAVVHAALYLVLLGIFGAHALGEMDYPAVTLMSTVKISGGFLKRTDAFMFAVWFFTLFALLGSCVFYGGKLLAECVPLLWRRQTTAKRERYAAFVMLVPVYAASCGLYRSHAFLEWCLWVLWYVATPFIVCVPLLLSGIRLVSDKRLRSRTGRMAAVLLLVCVSGVTCSGCATAELEDRNFPIEIAVDDPEQFAQAFLEAESAGNRMIDYNHLKVLILSRSFAEQADAMNGLLDFAADKKELPRNTYVVVAEAVEELMGTQETIGESVGNYLEEQFENVSRIRKQAYPTLGMLCQEQANRMETLFLPVVSVEEDTPVVREYFVWRRGEPAGTVDGSTAMLAYFSANEMEEYGLSLTDGSVVTLFSPHNAVRFVDAAKEQEAVVEITCSGKLEAYGSEAVATEDAKALVERQIERYMNGLAQTALQEQEIDLSGSYRKIGGGSREWYQRYCGQQGACYERDLEVVYRVSIDWVT